MSEKMREEFESWATGCFYEPHHKSASGEYIGGATSIAWEAWKASRESLVVEIPYPGHWTLDRDMVIEAIHAAGVRTK